MTAEGRRNEPAERLHANLGLIPLLAERGLARLDLDAALAEERRITVERISAGASDRIEAGVHPLDAFHQAMRDEDESLR